MRTRQNYVILLYRPLLLLSLALSTFCMRHNEVYLVVMTQRPGEVADCLIDQVLCCAGCGSASNITECNYDVIDWSSCSWLQIDLSRE